MFHVMALHAPLKYKENITYQHQDFLKIVDEIITFTEHESVTQASAMSTTLPASGVGRTVGV